MTDIYDTDDNNDIDQEDESFFGSDFLKQLQKESSWIKYDPAIAEKSGNARECIDMMREHIASDPDPDPIKRMQQHAAMLDMAFRRLLATADKTYENKERIDCDLIKYAAAFKAQDQYRRTVKDMKALNKRGPYKKQLAKCNEIIE